MEVLLREISSLGDVEVRGKAEELIRLLMELHGAGLGRLLDILDETGGEAAQAVFDRLGADPQVSTLLLLHGLHPTPLPLRVERALEEVRPYLASHGGNVELLSTHGGIVRLRLHGTCDGCPSSEVTMKLAVEKAIAEAAPEVAAVEVEGAASPAASAAAAAVKNASSSPLVTLGSGAPHATAIVPPLGPCPVPG
jgi:Fe-S cluster biogenesis protein NfuA